MVQDGINEDTPCYDSETESGRWEISFPATASGPTSPLVVVTQVPSGRATVICEPAGQQVKYRSNCCHAFDLNGCPHVLCGAYNKSKDQLTNRIGVYSLGSLNLLSTGPKEPSTMCSEYWPADAGCNYPEPAWQRHVTWQTRADSASVACHGSLLAWQTGRCSLTVIDMTNFTEVVNMRLDAVALPNSDIDELQWSSCGDFLAVQCWIAERAQLILIETCSWQHIACREYGTWLSLFWAPSKPIPCPSLKAKVSRCAAAHTVLLHDKTIALLPPCTH